MASKLTQKTTLYLNPYVKKFLQLRSVQENRTMSNIVNDQLAELLEDFEDTIEAEKRRNEPTIEWEIIRKELDKKHGLQSSF